MTWAASVCVRPFVVASALCLALACAAPGPASLGDLAANEQAFVEWIPLERVATDRITPIDAPGTAHLIEVLQRVVDVAIGGGEIMDLQLMFGGSEVSGILRGHAGESGFALDMLPDQLIWTEWAQIPSIMEGPHMVIPERAADEIAAGIQEWIVAHASLDVRAHELQLEVSRSRAKMIIRGAFRWAPQGRHLHSIVVSCLQDCR